MEKPLDLVLRMLSPDYRAERNEYKAKCPCHSDATDPAKWSLSVKETTAGNVVLHCFAGCDNRDIVRALGLGMSDLFYRDNPSNTGALKSTVIPLRPSNVQATVPASKDSTAPKPNTAPPTPLAPRKKVIANYDYVDEQGALLYRVVRTEPKGFFQMRPDGNGDWIRNLEGVRKVLYHLPAVIDAKNKQQTIFFVEGEKDADNLAKIGYTTTTNAMGANKWDNDYTTTLSGCEIILLPDNDLPGLYHSFQIINYLYKKSNIKIITLPDLPPKGDVSDWLESGGTQEKFAALLPSAQTPEEWLPTCVQTFRDYIKAETDPAKANTADRQLKTIYQWGVKAGTIEPPQTPDHILPEDLPKVTGLRFPCTDLGNAERLVAAHGDDLLHCHDQKQWYIWDKSHWVKDKSGEIDRRAKDTVRLFMRQEVVDADPDYKNKIMQWSVKSESNRSIKNMIELAKSEKGIPVLIDELDSNEWLLNCINGTLDLRKGELIPHDRKNIITKVIPYAYDPKSECPIFHQFLARILDNKQDIIDFLQRAVGYTLTGSMAERCIFILWGNGKNGKSTLTNALYDMLGQDYAKQTAQKALTIKKNETISEDVAALFGARLALTSETQENAPLDETLIKQLTGGDKVRARFLHQNSFEFKPTYKIWMATNHKPRINGQDDGIWDRIKLIPFTVRIPPDEVDMFLADRLKGELPGILRWAVEGCLKWQSEGLNPPSAVEKATATYRLESDSLAAFLDEHVMEHKGAWITAKRLYDMFLSWAKANGEKEIPQRELAKMIEAKGYEQKRRNMGNVWLNIAERAEDDRCEEPVRVDLETEELF